MSTYVLRQGLLYPNYVSKIVKGSVAVTIRLSLAKKFKTKEAARQYAIRHGINVGYQVVRIGPSTGYY